MIIIGDSLIELKKIAPASESPIGKTTLMEYTTKDSGIREEYASGMKRDIQTGKPRYDLIPRFMLLRWAELLERGATKYGEWNWVKADSFEEWVRFRASALRHFYQFLDGETDEDHAAAIYFNVAAVVMLDKKAELRGENYYDQMDIFRVEPNTLNKR